MHLKSLHLIGFKTFADETSILFDPGFTAVVGPNGSGKSNIVDGIKWVFGEKSAKGLRGEKMDDVIFHGSEARRPAGFAEVSVVFDNSERYFRSVDFPTLKITRRLYPDGDHEYYMNDSRIQRKELDRLLMDTGIGKSSYSIMEQGKVDQLLYSKPEERRMIFEEAAGISKFKAERKEALKKLEDTQKNLMRIQDILNGMQRELDIKEKQAEKTEIHLKLSSELKETDKSLRYFKLKSLREKWKKAEEELQEIKDKNQGLLSLISKETDKISVLEKSKAEKEQEIIEIDKKLSDHLSITKSLKEKSESLQSVVTEYSQSIQKSNQSINKDLESIEQWKLMIQNKEEDLEGIQKDCEFAIKRKEESLRVEDQIHSDLETSKNKIQGLKSQILESERSLQMLREELKQCISDLIGELDLILKDSHTKNHDRSLLKSSISNSLDGIIQKLTNNKNSQDLRTELESIKSKVKEYFEHYDLWDTLFGEKTGILNRKESLDNSMEKTISEIGKLRSEILSEENSIEKLQSSLLLAKEKTTSISLEIVSLESQKVPLLNLIENTKGRISESEARIQDIEEEITSLQVRKKEFETEISEITKKIELSYNEFISMTKSLESQKNTLKSIIDDLQLVKDNIRMSQEDFNNLIPVLSEKERNSSVAKVHLDSMLEELYNEYSMTEEDLVREKSDLNTKQNTEETKLRKIRNEIQQLGSINPLAIEEYSSIKQIYDHNLSQKEDIESSKRDVEEILKSINQESEKLFMETFEAIKINFQETFSTLFQGGRATIELSEKDDSLNAGIEILAEPPGKHVQNLRLLSGGEKSLTAIALMFAIYMVKPSPFCFLDEIDAALDEVNKLRFCSLLDKFKSKTQFVVISHAQSTITRANAIFGVTNEEPGISKILSLRLEEAKEYSKNIFSKAV